MHYIILLFAIFLVVCGAIILIKPAVVFGVLEKHARSIELHVVAVVVRVLLGIVLLLAAPASRFPLVLQIIGWVSLIAGIVLAVIGRQRFIKLMDWGMTVLPKNAYALGIVAILFGGFLGYAVV